MVRRLLEHLVKNLPFPVHLPLLRMDAPRPMNVLTHNILKSTKTPLDQTVSLKAGLLHQLLTVLRFLYLWLLVPGNAKEDVSGVFKTFPTGTHSNKLQTITQCIDKGKVRETSTLSVVADVRTTMLLSIMVISRITQFESTNLSKHGVTALSKHKPKPACEMVQQVKSPPCLVSSA